MKFFKSLYNFFISIKLAVVVLVLIAILTAVGTIIESKYNQEIANKIIYSSFLMIFVLILLSINLSFVLIDRWPWKKRQTPFILAHIGILTMILGSVMTKYLGTDAVMSLKEGESSAYVQMPEKEIKIYSSYNGSKFVLLYQQDVDFFFKRPSEEKNFVISIPEGKFYVQKYLPYGMARLDYKEIRSGKEPAVRFYLGGQMGQFVDWIHLEKGEKKKTATMGPAKVTFTKNKNYSPKNRKELVLFVDKNKLYYQHYLKNKKAIKVGESFKTPWMDFEFRLIEFYPQSQREFVFEARKTPNDKTLEAIKVQFQENSAWVGENAYIRFFTKDKVYAFGYVNKSKPIGFELKLLDFRMTNYQGSTKAKTYESEVEFEGIRYVISMNEPLKHNGYTFYQSSFEKDETGEATVSIFSVNQDPGRFLKYLGGILVSLGVILLFYRRKIFGPKRK